MQFTWSGRVVWIPDGWDAWTYDERRFRRASGAIVVWLGRQWRRVDARAA